ncbi:hypothetical protein CHS0354_027671 [Potamilus streckersoni]|uniref:Proton-coupled folate transporter n=1 Tax=Potamilus streckersoni TaxID=2493646 RepID=A0AAE0W572_9BIVA|nr:hypothetical protein CHS0354_027671 [Potamilus streckersoni]
MEHNERKPLLGSNVVNEKEFHRSHCFLLPVILLEAFALSVYYYISIEYTHNYFQRAIIGNNGTGNDSVSVCNANTSDPLYQSYVTVQQETSRWTMYYTVASGVPGIFLSIVIGTYADSLGRRFVLFIALLGFFVKSIVLTAVIYFDANLIYILIGTFIEGCAGGFLSFLAGSFSYVSDITTMGKKRSFAIISVEMITGIAITAGTFGTGYFITIIGYFYSMVLTTGCIFIAMLIVICCIPETCRNYSLSTWATICNTLGKAIEFYVSRKYYGKRWKYAVLLISFCFVSLAGLNRSSVETLYQLGAPFCWDEVKVGIFGTVRKGIESILGVLLAPLLLKCLSLEMLTILGLVSTAGSMVLEGLAKTETVLYLGSLFAGICAVETVCNILSTLISNETYSATVSIMTGFVFFTLAAETAIAALFIVIYLICSRPSPRKENILQINNETTP